MNLKNIFKKQNVMPVAILGAICLVVAALMGAVNLITAPIIKKAEEQKVYDSLRVVLDGDFEQIDLPDNSPATATGLYKVTEGGSLVGHVVTLAAKGYAGTISLTVGIDKDGKVTKAVVTNQSETHGKAGMANYTDGFAGTDAETAPEVSTFTGATISSTAIKNAIIDALNTVSGNVVEEEEEVLPREESQIIDLAAAMIGEGAEVIDVTPEGTELVKRVYKDVEGSGYVAYVVVISPNYGTVETETLIYVGNNGKIKSVNKLVWKTSDAMYGYVPPTADVVDAFYAKLANNDLESFKEKFVATEENTEVEHVTNATSTTGRLVESILEALSVTTELIRLDMPRGEDAVIDLVKSMLGAGATVTNVTPSGTELVKRVYKDNGGNGYIVYVVVISPNYGTVETETLIHIGNNGKIKSVNKLVWKTSDAMYGYVPPTAEVVDAFYAKLANNDLESFKEKFVATEENTEVEHVTNATSTTGRLVNGLLEALVVTDELIKKDMPRGEDEILDLAEDMVGAGATFVNVTPDNSILVKRIYKEENRKGYVAYVVVISPNYGTVETETLIHIGNDGKIKSVEKLVWKTSDAMYGYVPPTEETVDAFYAKLADNDLESFKEKFVAAEENTEVEHVTNATGTTGRLVESVLEALTATVDLIKKDMPRTESEVISAASALVGGGATFTDITPKGTNLVRRVYKDNGGNGYVAYVVVISPNYGTVETETLIHIDNEGRIVGVKKLVWKTSDAMYGYVPPTEETVDAFYAKLAGNNSESFASSFTGEGAEHVTNATGTTGRLVESITEALDVVDEIIIANTAPNNAARIVGIVALALAVLCPIGLGIYTCIRRRKNI